MSCTGKGCMYEPLLLGKETFFVFSKNLMSSTDVNGSCCYCNFEQEIPVIESTWEVERGKYFVKLSRPSVYGGVLRQVMLAEQGICDRCAIVTDGSAIVNCTLLNDDMKGADSDQLTLDQLRLLMLSEHVGRLLLNNGFVLLLLVNVFSLSPVAVLIVLYSN